MSSKTMETYKALPFEERQKNSAMLLRENPLRVPVLVTCNNGKINLNKHEFLVPKQLKVVHFTATLRRSINLSPESAIYLYSKNHMLKQDRFMGEIYEKHKDPDGFLYINVSDIPYLGSINDQKR